MLALADELDRSPEEIEVLHYEPVDWPNACLGLPAEGELCAQVITPGWRIILRLHSAEYELHTDEFGSQVRRG